VAPVQNQGKTPVQNQGKTPVQNQGKTPVLWGRVKGQGVPLVEEVWSNATLQLWEQRVKRRNPWLEAASNSLA